MAMHSKMFQISEGLDNALDDFVADLDDNNVSQVIRQAIADYIGYDLENEPPTIRGNRKYASEAERKAAQASRNKRRNAIKRDLVKAYNADPRDNALIDRLLAELAAISPQQD